MSDFLAGMSTADRLNALERRLDDFLVNHESNPGVHAAAFAAHGQSPGPVEDAEELAGDIIDNAAEVAETPVEVSEAGTEEITDAADAITDAAEEAGETIADAAEDAAETIADAVPDVQPSEPVSENTNEFHEEPVKEREPRRVHPLHRRINFGRRGEVT